MAIKKILVGTDFSKQADLAIQHAMALAEEHGADVVLVHAVNLSMFQDGHPYFTSMPASYFSQVKELQVELREKLSEEIARLGDRGVDVSMVFVDEAPETALVRVAADHNVDLIVVGSHGRSGLTRFLVGSVSESIAKHAACDVLIARSEKAGPYRKILVPTDFSECSERALERATVLAKAGDTIELLHGWQLPGGPVTYWDTMGDELRDSIQSGVEAFAAKCMSKHAESSATLAFSQGEGDARQVIEERVAKGDIGIVVMGTHSRKGLQRLLLGSIAHSTLRHVETSVYLVR